MLHERARAHLAAEAAAGKAPIQALTVEQARRRQDEEAAARARPLEPVALVADHLAPSGAGGVPVRLYHPDPGGRLPVLVYLHGGGWVLGGVAFSDAVCRRLANASGCVIASVEYRLAPEHPFPAGLEDAWTATRFVASCAADLHVDAARMAVGGDSAGGNLAAVVARRARDERGPGVGLQVLVYPVTAHDPGTPSASACAEGYGLETAGMRWYWDHYAPAGLDRSHPDLSPLRAEDLSGLPPALILTAEHDPLRDEGEAYGARLAEAGVPVTCKRYPGSIHGFLDMLGEFDEADEAIEAIAKALQTAFAAS